MTQAAETKPLHVGSLSSGAPSDTRMLAVRELLRSSRRSVGRQARQGNGRRRSCDLRSCGPWRPKCTPASTDVGGRTSAGNVASAEFGE